MAGTLELIIAKQDLDGVTRKIEKGILSNVIKEVSANQLESLITETDSIPLRLLAVVFFSQDSGAEMFQGATAGINKGYEEKFQELKNSDIYAELLERFSKEELAELQSTLRQNVIAQINQKLTMKVAKPYRMYSDWKYYLEDSISLLKNGIDYSYYWPWKDFSFLHLYLKMK